MLVSHGPSLPPRILLVDDEDLLSWCIEMELGAQGFEVKSADSVRSAQEACRQFSPDLIICDQGLPDGRGTEFIQSLSAAQRVPTIMMTAFTPPKAEDLAAVGIQTCLRKPFDLEVLAREVRRHLTSSRPGGDGAGQSQNGYGGSGDPESPCPDDCR